MNISNLKTAVKLAKKDIIDFDRGLINISSSYSLSEKLPDNLSDSLTVKKEFLYDVKNSHFFGQLFGIKNYGFGFFISDQIVDFCDSMGVSIHDFDLLCDLKSLNSLIKNDQLKKYTATIEGLQSKYNIEIL